MQRKRTIFSLALSAIVVLGAAVASSALAQGKITSDGPVTLKTNPPPVLGPITLTATQTGGAGSNALTAFGGTFECSNASYLGHKYATTPHTAVSSGATQVTVTPNYGTCTLFGKPATVDMNGCDYVLGFGGTTAADKFSVSTTIACSGGKHIQITLYDTAGKHTEAKSFCTVTITEKVGSYTGLSATDTTNGTIDISGTIKELSVDEKSESGLCAEASWPSGEIHLDLKVSGPRAISISDKGELKWEESEPAPTNLFSVFGSTFGCSSVVYTGHKLDSTPKTFTSSNSSTVTITPHYSGCTANLATGVKPITVKMTSCDYAYTISSATSGGWGLTLHIKCATPGDKIHFEMYNNAAHTELICSLTFGEQTVSGALVFNEAGGTLSVLGTFTGISGTRSGLCLLDGKGSSTSSGTFSTEEIFEGRNEEGGATSISIS